MAERRMFAKSIVLSDAFLDMPLSARCLYFTLGMMADDDGFVGSPKAIMRQCGASQDDMKLLLAKRYVLAFESGVIVIKHWRMNNYLQNDRRKPTTYLEELSTLTIDEKGAYTEANKAGQTYQDQGAFIPVENKEPMSDARKLRSEAKKKSSLPSSFDNRIRNAFVGHRCPICNVIMGYDNNLIKPTIQHNLPISRGGEHEIDNISVICQSCNTSLQNKVETPPYNTEEVKAVWECIGNVYTGKDSIGKDSKDNNRRFTPPTVEEVKAYCLERKNTVDPESFVSFYESKGWMIGKNKMKDWKAAVRTWEQKEKEKPVTKKSKFDNFNQRKYDYDELMKGAIT